VRFCAASDQSVLVYLGEEISLAVHGRVEKLLRVLQKNPPHWLRNIQPAYASLMVTFDPCRADHSKVEAALKKFEARAQKSRSPKTHLIEIPVCYGGAFGPDLEEVAKLHNLKKSQVIAHHTAPTYHAYFLGFSPGFAYLGDLPEAIATPRLESPRKKVPAGSVGIAGKQTGVYPSSTPGGWRLIGRTPVPMFRPERKPMTAISIGDQVKFHAISEKEFWKWGSA
jgi:inhibitor of KinA